MLFNNDFHLLVVQLVEPERASSGQTGALDCKKGGVSIRLAGQVAVMRSHSPELIGIDESFLRALRLCSFDQRPKRVLGVVGQTRAEVPIERRPQDGLVELKSESVCEV